MTIILCDIDGVVADSSKRFAKAYEGMSNLRPGQPDWNIAFDSKLIPLDTPIDGALEALQELNKLGWLEFITSRPSTLEAATKVWFTWNLPGFEPNRVNGEKMLAIKFKEQVTPHAYYVQKFGDKGEKWVKTSLWKAAWVEMWAENRNANEVIVFIDDEEINRKAVEALGLDNVKCYASLAEAVAAQ